MTALDGAGWLRPVADVALLALVGLVLRRLGRDPTAAWQAREAAVRAVFDDLRGLVAQAEGLARDLDDKLATRAGEMRSLLDESATLARRLRNVRRAEDAARTAPSRGGDPLVDDGAADLAARVDRLARAALPVEEIARRLDVSAAEVRLLIGIGGGGESRPRAAAAGRQK